MSPLAIKSQEMHVKKTIDISKSDYCLFGSNVASLASLALDYSRYSSQLLKNVLNVTQLATVLGESLASAPSFDRLYTALPGLALFGTRLFIDNQAKSNPSLRIISLALNAYGTCVLAKKAITEAVKCYNLSLKDKISNLDIAKVYVIHGTNAVASLFRTCTAAIDYKTFKEIEIADKQISEITLVAGKTIKAFEDKFPKATQEELDTFKNNIRGFVDSAKLARKNHTFLNNFSSPLQETLLKSMRAIYSKIQDLPYLCSGAGDPPRWGDLINNQITSETGQFLPEILFDKVGHKDCPASWKEFYARDYYEQLKHLYPQSPQNQI